MSMVLQPMGSRGCSTARASRANSPFRLRAFHALSRHCDFARGTISEFPLRGLTAKGAVKPSKINFLSPLVASRQGEEEIAFCPQAAQEKFKKFFRAPARRRALRPAFPLVVPFDHPSMDAYPGIHAMRRGRGLRVEEGMTLVSTKAVVLFRLSSVSKMRFDLFSLLPAAFPSGADASRCSSFPAAFQDAGREAAHAFGGTRVHRFGRGKLKKEFAASPILRFNERRSSRIGRSDKVCVCRTAQPAAARSQTPLQGGSAPVDPRDDRSERTR